MRVKILWRHDRNGRHAVVNVKERGASVGVHVFPAGARGSTSTTMRVHSSWFRWTR